MPRGLHCSFCGYSGDDGSRMMLKLLPSMLGRLGLKQDTVYYACSEEWELDAVTIGKRARWKSDAELKVDATDLYNLKYQDNIAEDHTYSTNNIEDGDNEKVDSVKMGKDFFMDTREIILKEETVEGELRGEEAGGASCSQESSHGLFDSEDDSDEDFRASQASQASQESISQDTTCSGKFLAPMIM